MNGQWYATWFVRVLMYYDIIFVKCDGASTWVEWEEAQSECASLAVMQLPLSLSLPPVLVGG